MGISAAADRARCLQVRQLASSPKGFRVGTQSKKKNPNNERKVMNDKFDELAKGLAQSVTRRGALKKFGRSFAGIVLASLGMANKAKASDGACRGSGEPCLHAHQCCSN